MRLPLFIVALGLTAPAVAQPGPSPQLPPELAGGQVADQLQPVLRAVAHALLDLPVGEIQAAVENRPVRAEDRDRRVRDMAGIDERQLDRRLAEGSGAVKAGTEAISRSLPVITRALNQAGDEIARTVNNLPSPTYPRR